MNTHHLKTWPTYFNAVKNGSKKFEIRVNDRDYRTGDILVLEEFQPCKKCGGTGTSVHISGAGLFLKSHKEQCDCCHPFGVYTGETVTCRVTYTIGNEFGLVRDAVVMSIELIP